jgi:hypothetical protein
LKRNHNESKIIENNTESTLRAEKRYSIINAKAKQYRASLSMSIQKLHSEPKEDIRKFMLKPRTKQDGYILKCIVNVNE